MNHELKNIPEEWPIFAIGGEAYKALAYMYPERIVIGILRPTDSHGHFRKLFNDNDELLAQYKIPIKTLRDGTNGQAIWLSNLK